MEKRMNKEELIELIDSLGIDLNECVILSSSSLVIRGLFPDAGDLDLAVSKKGLEQLKSKYNLKQKPNGFYIVTDKVECVLDEDMFNNVESYDNYNLQSLEHYYKYMKEAKREKDKVKLEILGKIVENPEYLDLYDEEGNLTGEKVIRYKGMNPRPGEYIKISIVFIENSQEKFLIQKTSKEKGGMFATTGGHVKSGFNSKETIVEEVKEELGLDFDEKDIEYVDTYRGNHYLLDTYYLKKDIDISDIIVQEEEVEYVTWLSIDEIKKLIKEGKFRKGNIEPFEYIIDNKKGFKH